MYESLGSLMLCHWVNSSQHFEGLRKVLSWTACSTFVLRTKVLQSFKMLHISYPVTQHHIPEILTALCILMVATTQGSVEWLYENEMEQGVSLLVSTVLSLNMQVRLRMCGAVPQPLRLLCSVQL